MLLVGLYGWAWRYAREVRPQCARYVAGFSAGALVWGASLLVPEPARYGLWVLGIIVVEIATPLFAQLTVLEELPFQVSHLPERLGLFTIIVLGESIVVTGVGVADTEWPPDPCWWRHWGLPRWDACGGCTSTVWTSPRSSARTRAA
jgi:low temperature requirement protein LtrA